MADVPQGTCYGTAMLHPDRRLAAFVLTAALLWCACSGLLLLGSLSTAAAATWVLVSAQAALACFECSFQTLPR